jgi:hypothetical protein
VIEAEALETSPLVGKPLRSLDLPDGVRIGAIYRDKQVLKPDGSLKIKAKDRVVMFAALGFGAPCRADVPRQPRVLLSRARYPACSGSFGSGVMFALIVPAVLFAIADGMRDLALVDAACRRARRFCRVDGAGLDRRFRAALGGPRAIWRSSRCGCCYQWLPRCPSGRLAGLSWVDSWFEAVSALTTSGATLIAAGNRAPGDPVLACEPRMVWWVF